MKTRKLFAGALLVLFLVIIVFWKQKLDNSQITDVQAVEIAGTYTGIPDHCKVGAPVLERRSFEVPFLHSKCSGKVWRISYNNVELTGAEGSAVLRINLDVYIDSQTGSLVAARHTKKLASDLFPDPPAKSAESQLKEAEIEYSAFSTPPKTKLVDALSEMNREFGNITNLAPDINISCVIMNERGKTNGVWLLTTKGIMSATMSRRSEVPLWARSFMRHCIDTSTGKWLYSVNFPHWMPPSSNEDSISK